MVQAQFERCIMSLETKESTANVIVIHAKGTNLHFSPKEFVVVIGLNCVSNKNDFVFDDDLPNRLIEDYFGVIPRLHFDLVESSRDSDYLWGSIAFEKLAKSLNKKLKPKVKFYMLHGMPLAIQIWLYECCSTVPHNVSFKNIELTSKEISCFRISKKVVPTGKKLKQQHKGLDEQTPKRTPPPRAAKKLSVRTPIFMPIHQKEKVASKRKDINQSASKKSIPIQSPDSSLCSSGNEDDFISKKVFHKFCNEVLQEMISIHGLVSTRWDEIMNAISDIKKKDKNNQVDNQPMGEADKTTLHHEFTPNFVHDLYKNSKGTLNTGGVAETTVNASTEDESKNNECDAEKIVDTSEDYQAGMNENKSPKDDSKKVEQDFSDSQVTIPDELLPSLNAYLNQERSIIVHSSANKVQETPMHVSRIKRPSRFKESPFTMNFGSAAEGKHKIFNQKHPFVSHPINDIEDTKITNKFLKWLSVDVLKFHAKRSNKQEHYKKGKFKISVINFRVLAIENKNWFYILGAPGQSWSDEYIDVCFYYLRKKSKYDPNTSYKYSTVDCNFMNIINSVLAVYRIDDASLNADAFVYDSLSSASHDAGVLAEVEKLVKVIPICLVACKFYEKKGIDTANHPNYKSYDKMDLFNVYVVEDLPQQPSDSLDCGLYMVTYAECLTFEDLVSPVDFDPDLIRTRYASILWNYGMKKEEENAQSNDEAPMRPPREIGLTEDIEVHEI
ncbi:hypothetical protein FXO38_04438 [Capsicum annuum]|nr:hypothetical protein FXO38_04438 [Capsicum annuum]